MGHQTTPAHFWPDYPKGLRVRLSHPTAKFLLPNHPLPLPPTPHGDGAGAEHGLALTRPEPAMPREGPDWDGTEAAWITDYLSRRTAIITDLEEQISELTAIIEQMNRAHRSAPKLVSGP